MKYSDYKPRECVAQGIELLDSINPYWDEQIELDILDIGDCNRCILGQLYNHFLHGMGKIAKYINSAFRPDEYGFNIPAQFGDLETRERAYLDLKIAWTGALTERRQG
jgi:hypothetical protein